MNPDFNLLPFLKLRHQTERGHAIWKGSPDADPVLEGTVDADYAASIHQQASGTIRYAEMQRFTDAEITRARRAKDDPMPHATNSFAANMSGEIPGRVLNLSVDRLDAAIKSIKNFQSTTCQRQRLVQIGMTTEGVWIKAVSADHPGHIMRIHLTGEV